VSESPDDPLSQSLFSTEARQLTTPPPRPLIDPDTPIPGSLTQFPLQTAQFTDPDNETFDNSFTKPETFFPGTYDDPFNPAPTTPDWKNYADKHSVTQFF
jgi:hypothetical protein